MPFKGRPVKQAFKARFHLAGCGDKNKIFILIKMSHSITQKNINSGVIN